MAQVHTIKSIFSITLMTAALGLTACSSPADDPDIKARQDSMKSWGDAMGVMGDMVKAPDTFDAAIFQEQASFLAEDAATPWSHFENQEAIGNATEAVWSNADDFSAESDNFQKVTAELNGAAQTDTKASDVQPAFGAVGASCKSCHTEFRVANN